MALCVLFSSLGCANGAARQTALDIVHNNDDDSVAGSDAGPGQTAQAPGSNGEGQGQNNGENGGGEPMGSSTGTGATPGNDAGSASNLDSGRVSPADANAPVVANIVLSEIMARPKGGSGNEWIELYNAGDKAVDLAGCVLARGTFEQIEINRALPIEAKGYVVLARDAAAQESGVQVDFEYQSLYLLSSAVLTLTCNGVEVDKVDYAGAEYGAALQLDARYAAAGKNDVSAAWCQATASLAKGENLGTPRAANRECEGAAAP